MKKSLIIKIGGEAANDQSRLSGLARDLAVLKVEYNLALVHGGGKELSVFSKGLGIEPEFMDGVRMTGEEEMRHVDMVLAGLINKRLVRFFTALNAVGISGSDGGLFTGEPLSAGSHTGKIVSTQPLVLEALWQYGFLPVIASSSMAAGGRALNINADEAAFGIAAAAGAEALVFLSDIPGVLKDDRVLPVLKAGQIKTEIRNGCIKGGMIPKVEASALALSRGVSRIIIGSLNQSGGLKDLLEGRGGTVIRA